MVGHPYRFLSLNYVLFTEKLISGQSNPLGRTGHKLGHTIEILNMPDRSVPLKERNPELAGGRIWDIIMH
jgi:hypothetical protein